jgi:hypothetical protein
MTLHWLWIVPLVLLNVFLASPRFRGDIAQTRVRRILAAGLEKSRYTVINRLRVPAGGGTIDIDHLVVSKFGVFVIESQYARGWVAGGEFQDRWKQYHLRRFTRLDNPMHRNALQAQAVENLLGIPASKIHRIVVLLGQKGFKTPMPENLLTPDRLIRYIRKNSQQLLDDRQAAKALKAVNDVAVRDTGSSFINRWSVLRFILLALLAGGLFLAFHEQAGDAWDEYSNRREQAASPELFNPDGSRKTEEALWEDSLVCVYSSDTGRCFCNAADGKKVKLETAKCRSLAERGSILQQ